MAENDIIALQENEAGSYDEITLLESTVDVDNVPTADEKAALAGTGTPSGANLFVTEDDLPAAYSLPLASTSRGGIKADTKTTESVEAKIDGTTEKLYVPAYPAAFTATTTATLTLVAVDWVAKVQTLVVTGVTTTSANIVVIETIADGDLWSAAKIYATAQDTDEITFTCDVTPTSDIDFKIVILK